MRMTPQFDKYQISLYPFIMLLALVLGRAVSGISKDLTVDMDRLHLGFRNYVYAKQTMS